MSHPAKLSLRAPPHLPFVQGWPGIPASPGRKPSAVHGTVEVRIGPQPIKARWVRAEIRKYESAPPGFPSNTTGETWEHVGEVATLWAAPAGKEWDTLQQADFKFYIPLPDHLPPSVDMSKGAGIRYELVAALCYRQKGGVFKKESAPILKISEEIRITNHEAHSAWPIYNIPDSRSVTAANGELTLNVARPTSAFGPGDRILFTASLKSMRRVPFKLKGFECHLHETVTVMPPATDGTKAKKGKGPPQPIKKTRTLASARQAMDESVGKGGEKAARMEMAVPSEKISLTVRHARNLKVEYDLEVKAVCDSGIPEISLRGIGYVVGPFARPHAQQAVSDIGHVDALCPGVPPPTANTPSTIPSRPTSVGTPPHSGFVPNLQPFPAAQASPQPPFPPGGFYPGGQQPRNVSQPVQGFVANDNWRRKSSGSTITTTTTATYDQHQANGRPQSMQYKSGTPNPPSASSTPGLGRSGTVKTYDSNLAPSSPIESIDEQRSVIEYPSAQNNRYSSMTSNTFGPWDGDLRKTMVKGDNNASMSRPGSAIPNAQAGSSKPPPSAWISAEQEKAKLFDEARNRAARAQQSSGADLQDLGLDIPTVAPPEYAPRRPEMPKEDYKAPSRPVSVYTAKSSVPGTNTNLGPSTVTSPASSPFPEMATLPDISVPEQTALHPAQIPPNKPFPQSVTPSVSMSTASSSVGASSGSRPNMEPAYLSAAEEKEQQRRRFEQAQRRVVSGSSSVAPSTDQDGVGASANNDGPIPYDQIFPTNAPPAPGLASSSGPATITKSGVSEKEQGSRYQEAQNGVIQNAGSGFPQTTSSAPSTAPGSTNGHTETTRALPAPVLSEKEQMRRYYEAQDRVAHASGQGSSTAFSSPQMEVSPSRSTTTASPAPPKAPAFTAAAPPSAGLSEKEQMRRYYEAQDRVAQAGGQGSTPGLRSSSIQDSPSRPNNFDPPPPEEHVVGAVSGSGASGVRAVPLTSALSEKEQMRRFYEAQDRVARAAAGQGSPETGSSSAFNQAGPDVPRYASPAPAASSSPIAGPSSGSSAAQQRAAFGSGSGAGSGSGSGFMSAEAEKEMMRKRFEDAQAAVERNKRESLSPPPAASSSRFTLQLESPNVPRESTFDQGKPKGRTSLGSTEASLPAGPPPPLPTKPPAEYINLLSPVTESGPSFATFGVRSGSSAASGSS